jgi:predicted  nucleic acid-binding Zn-ribbon protein
LSRSGSAWSGLREKSGFRNKHRGMEKNITTIEGLAALIHETMASKEDIQGVREDIAEVNSRLDRIEKHILADYGRRIESLEQDLKRLKDALAV